jgi:hypothetical protein
MMTAVVVEWVEIVVETTMMIRNVHLAIGEAVRVRIY